jgi:hypothetical protein
VTGAPDYTHDSWAWKRLYRTNRWKRLSLAIRAAAGYRCWIYGCERPATETDHIIPPAELHARGELARFCDPAILRPSCRFHNVFAAGRVERDAQLERMRRQHERDLADEAALAAAPPERRAPLPRIY